MIAGRAGKFGRFALDPELVYGDPAMVIEGLAIMQATPVRVWAGVVMDAPWMLNYMCLSPHFEFIVENQRVPAYDVRFEPSKGGSITVTIDGKEI